jgi:hypothetical protein
MGRLISTYDGSAGWTTYIYGNGQRLARVDNSGQIQYFHNDYLGSARMITQGPAKVFKIFEKPKPNAWIGVPGSPNSSTVRRLLNQSARRFVKNEVLRIYQV